MFITNDLVLQDLLDIEQFNDLPSLINSINLVNTDNVQNMNAITLDLFDLSFLEEIKNATSKGIKVYFGDKFQNLKCIVRDNSDLKHHEIFLCYKASKKLVVTSVHLPHSPFQDREYSSIEEVLNAFRSHIDNLSSYFYALDQIDKFCTVMEPVNPTYKEDYRRIILDDRIWLHVEVTPEGLATNIHLIGQSEQWQDKLQVGLLNWDHDKDIVENVMTIFDLVNFPTPAHQSTLYNPKLEDRQAEVQCGICLCAELGDNMGVPQPLCQNRACGVFFHRNCLFQWLVSSSGGRPPAFGVATGNCPACFQSVACSEREN